MRFGDPGYDYDRALQLAEAAGKRRDEAAQPGALMRYDAMHFWLPVKVLARHIDGTVTVRATANRPGYTLGETFTVPLLFLDPR